ncbi:unnamed protein product [Enterobius vermicularis]|uniref:C-type lectin domain-containing protein n=1 Tax=Enterobius vermicularis TaxID=51028 RepID=A0A0N4VR64_ENTVE|nr:unnamed protein product [Enterobius vermicularis]
MDSICANQFREYPNFRLEHLSCFGSPVSDSMDLSTAEETCKSYKGQIITVQYTRDILLLQKALSQVTSGTYWTTMIVPAFSAGMIRGDKACVRFTSSSYGPAHCSDKHIPICSRNIECSATW